MSDVYLPSTRYAVNVKDYGAKGDGVTNDNTAVQNALSAAIISGQPLYFPSTTDGLSKAYLITASLDLTTGGVRIIGDGKAVSGIRMTTSNTALLKVGAGLGSVENISLSYSSQPLSTDTNSNAIEFYNATKWTFRDIHFYQVGRALYIPQISVGGTGQNTCFSCLFEDFYINNYTINAINFQSFTGASTGSVWNNIYTYNGYTATGGGKGGGISPTDFPIIFGLCDEQVINQINIEGVNCTATDPVCFNACNGIQINGIHIENVGLSSFGIGFFNPFGDSRIGIRALSIHFCDVNTTGGGSRYLIRTGGNNLLLWIDGVSMNTTNTVTNSNFIGVSNAATGGAMTVVNCDTTGLTALTNYVTSSLVTPIKRFNDIYYHRLDGNKNIVWGTAAPTSGTWAVGDECVNIAPTAGGTDHWRCTGAGTPGTWTSLTLI